jgi:hypothetical protein
MRKQTPCFSGRAIHNPAVDLIAEQGTCAAAVVLDFLCWSEGDGASVPCCTGGTAWLTLTAEARCSRRTRTLR